MTHDHKSIIQFLIEKNADCNVQDNNKGYTPLHLSVMKEYIKTIKFLLTKG